MEEKKETNEIMEKMKVWRAGNRQATLTEIEEAVEAELAQLRKQLVEEMIQEEAAELPDVPNCPGCGETMVKNGRRRRQLKGKEGKGIELERQQWRCLTCGETLFPPG